MPRSLRLLMTADAVGGVWQYATDLAHALAPLGIEATIALLGPAPSTDQRTAARGIRLIETGLPLDWLCDGPAPVLAAGAAIAALAAAESFDRVQLNMPTLAAAARPQAPTIAVAHGCVATWWEVTDGTPLDQRYGWHRGLTGAGLDNVDRVVAPSAAYGAIVARHYGIAPPETVHNGRRPATAARPGALHDYVLTAGRLWDRAKDVATLDRVAGRLAIPFFAAGAARGPHGEVIASDHLVLLGTLGRAALARRLAARPVFVSAARFEPFGLAVLEAAAAGCALVLADIPTFRELWEGVARFVDPGDDAGFADAIEAIVGDAGARLALGEAARRRAARYTPDAMAAGMARLFDGLGDDAARRAA